MRNPSRKWITALAASAAFAVAGANAGSALAAGGDIRWQEDFDLAGGDDVAVGFSLRGQKLFMVAGTAESSPGSGPDTLVVRAYDSKDNGAIEWEESFQNPDGDIVVGGVSASGNRVFVVGSRETASGAHHLFVKTYDGRKGGLLWEDEVDTGLDEGRANAVFLKGKTGWVVGSLTDAGTGLTKWWIRSYDARAGGLKWDEVPAGETTDDRGATHVYLQGSTLVVGGVGQDGGGTTDWRVRGYKTKDLSLLYEDTYDSGHGDDVISGMKGMGKRFVVGGTVSKAGGTKMYIRAFETKTGVFLWENEVDIGTNNTAAGIVGHGPCLFMGGEVDGDFFLRGYATFTGANMWTDVVDSGGFDAALSLGNFGSKTVFAVGTIDDGFGSGDLIIKNYAFHTGVVVWEDTQDIDGDDAITGIVAKGKNVFTIGQSDRGSGDQDWVVTNYER